MKDFFKLFVSRIKTTLKKLSFKTGMIILCLCVPFYILSFAQMALDISYSMKGILWIIFFGLAKTFQYTGLAIIGVEGVKKLKNWWIKVRNKALAETDK